MFFPVNWFIVYDKLGNGCKVDFPVRLQSKLKWSPTLYDKLPNGTVVVRKIFSEVLVVTLVLKRDVDFLLNLQSLMVKSFVNFCGLAYNISIPK